MIMKRYYYALLLLIVLPLISTAQNLNFVPQLGFKGYADLFFTPDGKYIISHQQNENTIIVWDAGLSKEVHHMKGKFPAVSPDSRYLAFLDNKILKIYELTSGNTVTTTVKAAPNDASMPYPKDFLTFSPESDYIAVSGTATKPEVIVYGLSGKNTAFRTPGFNPVFLNDRTSVVYSLQNKITKRDLNSQAVASIICAGKVICISAIPSGNELLVIAEKNNDSISIMRLDAANMKLTATAGLRMGDCYAGTTILNLSYLGDSIALIQQRNHYPVLWNVARNRIYRDNIEMDYALMYPKNNVLYQWFDGSINFDASGYCLEDTVGRIIAADIKSGTPIFNQGLYCKSYFQNMALHPSLPVLASGASSRIVLNDLAMNPKSELSGFNFDLRNMFFNPANNDLITLTQYYLTSFSLDKINIRDLMYAADMAFAANEKKMYMLDGDIYILDSAYNITDTIFTEQGTYRDSRLSLSDNDKVLATYNGNTIFTYDPLTKAEITHFDIACFWDKGVSTPLLDMAVSPTGHYMFYIYTPGTERTCPEGGLLLTDLQKEPGKSILPEHKNLGDSDYDFDFEPAAMFTADEKYLLYIKSDLKTICWFDLAQQIVTRKVVSKDEMSGLAPVPGSTSFLVLGNGKINVRSITTGEIINSYNIGSSPFTMARFNKSMTLLALGTSDNSIILFDWKQKKKIATLMTAYGRALIYTDDNYYFSSKEMLDAIAFQAGGKAYNFEQFDIQYNRPDIILERLGIADTQLIDAYKKAYDKRLRRMDVNPLEFTPDYHIPELDILNQQDIPLNTKEQELNINISARDKKYKLESFNVWVNDVPLYGRAGCDIKYMNSDSLVRTIKIPLSVGRNSIQLSCTNRLGIESRKAAFNIRYEKTGIQKPDLYLITIGVADYHDENINLKYPVKDGRDITALYTDRNAAAKENFNRIIIDSLYNGQATRENILALKKKLLSTTVDDVVIVSVSGHGLLDKNLDFYYATSDIDFANPSAKGLKYEELENLLDSIPSRQKLLLVDACHSGEVDKDAGTIIESLTKPTTASADTLHIYASKGVVLNRSTSGLGLNKTFELMQMMFTDLSKGTGTVVISAAAGTGVAIEGEQWKNGVFTYALINGLKNKLADNNEDGEVRIWEIKTYVANEVEKLTNGVQKPTMRTENLDSNWRIW
ncbi:MAG: caspase family protein [Bacteroidota bacterium]